MHRSKGRERFVMQFDHLVGERENTGRNLKVERLGCMGVDNQLKIWSVGAQEAGFSPLRTRPV
jgi:hypothetical protein